MLTWAVAQEDHQLVSWLFQFHSHVPLDVPRHDGETAESLAIKQGGLMEQLFVQEQQRRLSAMVDSVPKNQSKVYRL